MTGCCTKFVPMNFKKYTLKKFLISCTMLYFFIPGCSAVRVDDRYEKAVQKSERANAKFYEDDIDLSTYYMLIEKSENNQSQQKNQNIELWFNYEKNNANLSEPTKTNGFRVQIFSTTNYEEADSVRADLYFKTNQKNIYLLFEPPNYKVRIGDYTSQTTAQELAFKLNQLGFKNPLVVPDSVTVRND